MQDLQKALELHFLPESMWWADGCKTSSKQRTIVEKRIMRKPGKFETSYHVIEKDSPSGSIYALSQIRALFHAAHNEYAQVSDGAFTIGHPRFSFTPDAGPFSGMEFWSPALDVHVTRTDTGCIMEYVGEPYQNTVVGGLPEPTMGLNPKISITREDYSPSGKLLARTSVTYTQQELAAKTGMSDDDVRLNMAHVWTYVKKDPDTHVNNTSADFVVMDDGALQGLYYINGIPYHAQPNYKTMKVNYMKSGQFANHPPFVERWVLDNPGEETIPGSYNPMGFAWRIQREAGTLPAIRTVGGTKAALDGDTLTYNESKPAILWYQTEEYPAQGKNWGAECYMDLIAGIKTPTARGLN